MNLQGEVGQRAEVVDRRNPLQSDAHRLGSQHLGPENLRGRLLEERRAGVRRGRRRGELLEIHAGRHLPGDMHVVFASGYVESPEQLSTHGASILQKPFTVPVLLHRVRQTLDG